MKYLGQAHNTLHAGFIIAVLLICQSACTSLSHAQSSRPASSTNVTSFASPPPAFEPYGDNRLVGVWTTTNKEYQIAFLPNGRVASFDHRFGNYTDSSHHVTVEPGVYRVEGNKINYEWLISGPESTYFEVEGDKLVTYASPDSPYKTREDRVGGNAQAVAFYEQLQQKRLESAAAFMQNIPTGAAKLGSLHLQPYYNHDPNPTDIFPDATVYTTYADFDWVEGRHTYTPMSPDDPGITFQSFILMPNGRFIYDAWLHEFLAFDNFQNATPRNDQERRDRTVPAKHWQMFGKYRIIAQGDALTGDTVELLYSDGSRKIVQVVSGRQYMRVPGSRFNFINSAYSKQEREHKSGQ